jgi:hypothetical protein
MWFREYIFKNRRDRNGGECFNGREQGLWQLCLARPLDGSRFDISEALIMAAGQVPAKVTTRDIESPSFDCVPSFSSRGSFQQRGKGSVTGRAQRRRETLTGSLPVCGGSLQQTKGTGSLSSEEPGSSLQESDQETTLKIP